MDNLNLVKKVRFDAPNPSHTFTINNDLGSLIIIGDRQIHCYNSINFRNAPNVLTLDKALDNGRVIAVQHLPEIDSICCILSSGNAVLYDTTHTYPDRYKLSGLSSSKNGKEIVAAAKWSPEQTLLAVTDIQAENCILLNKEFEKICTIPLQATGRGRDANVNVGWGHRSTQFQGKAGKQNREKELTTDYTAYLDETIEQEIVQICWRPDGQYFAVSYLLENVTENNKNPEIEQSNKNRYTRQIRIFTRDGSYLAKSEPLPGLTSSLTWSSDLQLITTVQMKTSPPGIHVVFLEKNGLQHGEFRLTNEINENLVVTNSLWSNNNTNFLTICLYDKITKKTSIQTWKRYVYHWFKKFVDEDLPGYVNHMQYDPTDDYTLYVLMSNNQFYKYQFSHEICRFGSKILVANGNKLLLTDFSQVRPPPPMFQFEINLLEEPQKMPTHISLYKNLVSCLIGQKIIIYDLGDEKSFNNLVNIGTNQDTQSPKYQIQNEKSIKFVTEIEKELTPLQVYFVNENEILVRSNRTYDTVVAECCDVDYDGFGHVVKRYKMGGQSDGEEYYC